MKELDKELFDEIVRCEEYLYIINSVPGGEAVAYVISNSVASYERDIVRKLAMQSELPEEYILVKASAEALCNLNDRGIVISYARP